MFAKKMILTTILISFAAHAQTPPQGKVSEKVSLQDAIQTAILQNSRSKSNTLRLEAAAERLKAQKQSAYLPTISTGYSQDLKSSGAKQGSVSSSINLFNGFADYYGIKANECNYKRIEASYKSTNSNQQNTTGQIVESVGNNYVYLVSLRQNQKMRRKTQDRLNTILPFAKNNIQQSQIEKQISTIQISLDESISNIEIAEANYEYIVNSKAPSDTDTFNEIIDKTLIPDTAEQAYQISLTKSPEILGAKLSLECDLLSRKESRARLYGIRVDASATHTTDFNGSKKNATQFNFNAIVPFDLSRVTNYNAGQKNIQATELDLDDTIKKIKLELINNYKFLQSNLKSGLSYDALYQKNETEIDSKILSLGQLTEKEIDALFSDVVTQYYAFSTIENQKTTVIRLKHNIQKDIGTLFDTNQLFFSN